MEEGQHVHTNFFYQIDPTKVPSTKRTAEYLGEMRQDAGPKQPPPGYSCNYCKSTRHFLRDCPYKRMNMDAPERNPAISSGYICRACQQPGHLIRDCPLRRSMKGEDVVERCWFCLANPSVRKHLIVEIGEEAYLARPRDPIDDDHCLIIPIEHVTKMEQLSDAIMKDIKNLEDKLTKAFLNKLRVIARLMRSSRHHWHEQVFSVSGEKDTFIQFATDFLTRNQFESTLSKPKDGEYFELMIQDTSLFVPLPIDAFFASNLPKQLINSFMGNGDLDTKQLVTKARSEEELEQWERDGALSLKTRLSQQ